MVYVDPDGELLWLIPVIAAVVFGGTNVAIQAINGELHNFWDGVKAFGAGAVVGAAITTGVMAGLSVPILGAVIKGAGAIYAGTAAIGVVGGVVQGIGGDWSALGNVGKMLAGNFYLDGNRSFFGQVWQGMSRFSWELPQSTGGHAYSQVRNAFGSVDRVDYFGGATFATNEMAGRRDGISLGNYINLNISDKIEGRFADRVISDPLFMHEYGHTFDSQIFGLSYLFGVGLPSAVSAATSEAVGNGLTTHDYRWYEMRANRHSARYFGRYYGVDWNNFTTYPTRR